LQNCFLCDIIQCPYSTLCNECGKLPITHAGGVGARAKRMLHAAQVCYWQRTTWIADTIFYHECVENALLLWKRRSGVWAQEGGFGRRKRRFEGDEAPPPKKKIIKSPKKTDALSQRHSVRSSNAIVTLYKIIPRSVQSAIFRTQKRTI